MKCKHNEGWCVEKNVDLFVYPNGKVGIDFKSAGKKVVLEARCNYPECGARRTVSIKCLLVKMGKIKMSTTPPKQLEEK